MLHIIILYMSRGSKSCPGLSHVRSRVLPIKAWLEFIHDKAKVSKKFEIVIHRGRIIFILIEIDIKKKIPNLTTKNPNLKNLIP